MKKDDVYYFSATKLCWLSESLKESYISAGTWDDEATKVSFNIYKEYALCAPLEGKMLGADKNGAPIWIDIPPKTKNELIKEAENTKIELMQNAAAIITPLQDAIDLNMATDEECKNLMEWKTYRVLLSRIDISIAPNIEWPKLPK
ncbi:tail fiber assembly protein [Arsenophonus nasoniae]|nr:tail fiber assembly protein [Arsenophonus nasoniae]QBY42863.1 Caudovirales tail fiber assembly protein, lambda gpK [Arsenophonus nasoniae]WGM06927.1 tail fiber assembly protein [Arsenophonus nasoniae]WGM11808.1 tail fiber assembly protein [Arsenophonus nasoniae]WGM16497.1 tail fiber assembly protein [Arsenophonus nasoniae]